MEARKKFSPSLYKEHDPMGKQAGIYHLMNSGALWVGVNPSKYGCDLHYKLDTDIDTPPLLLECEVKLTWDGGQFPYDTIQVLERKTKYFQEGADILLLSGNFKDYLIIKPQHILELEPVEVQNKYVGAFEFYYQVPLEKAEFYQFSRPLRPKSMLCLCGNVSYDIKDRTLVCDQCHRRMK